MNQANVGITLQIMADNFNLRGVILLGYGEALNDSLSVGSVVIPKWIAATGVWTWQVYIYIQSYNQVFSLSMRSFFIYIRMVLAQPFYAEEEDEGQLKFREFNYPEGGANLLGSVEYEKSQIYVDGKVKETFWTPAISGVLWHRAASKIWVHLVVLKFSLKFPSKQIYIKWILYIYAAGRVS